MTCAKMMAATATATLTAGMRRPRVAGRIDAGMMRCFLQTLAYGWPRPLVARRVRPMFSRLAASALAAKRQGGKNWDADLVWQTHTGSLIHAHAYRPLRPTFSARGRCVRRSVRPT